MKLEYFQGKDRCQIEVALRYVERVERKELLLEALEALNDLTERYEETQAENNRLEQVLEDIRRLAV
jgi:predicted component of type VI protein secretion system